MKLKTIIIFNFLTLVLSVSFNNCQNNLNSLIDACLYDCDRGTWTSHVCDEERNYDICKEAAKQACDAYIQAKNENNSKWGK
jgi:hypothetical protein